jgi:alkane 1-monooxygenase
VPKGEEERASEATEHGNLRRILAINWKIPVLCRVVAKKAALMPRSFLAFALATFFPLPFLAMGALAGGWMIWVALIYITLFIAGVDEFVPSLDRDGSGANDEEADFLSLALALVHFALLFLCIWSLAGGAVRLFSVNGLALFAAIGLFMGQVGNSNAHELIHRKSRGLRHLGRWIYISLLFGHHASAHPAVHHTYVATPLDPNTSRMNEGFYRFFGRAWLGSFRAGLLVEEDRLARKERGLWDIRNPYVTYIGGAVSMLLISAMLAGWRGMLVHLALAGFAQTQLMLSDYVQHYGLERRALDGGGYEPVSSNHSWNSPHWLSSLWMLNAPRHSEHHAHPSKPFPQLENVARGAAPTLPYGLPVMACIALVPPLWRQVMNPHATAWRAVTQQS